MTRTEPGGRGRPVGTVPPRTPDAPPRRRAARRSRRRGPRGSRGFSGGARLTLAGLGVAAIALAAVTGWLAVTLQHSAAADQQRAAVLAAAQQEAADLTTLSHQTAGHDFAAVLAGSAGALRQQLAQGRSSFLHTLTADSVSSSGTVLDAGIMTINSRTATVLLNVRAVVHTKQTRAPETRLYHWRAGLVYSGGRWLVIGLEFV